MNVERQLRNMFDTCGKLLGYAEECYGDDNEFLGNITPFPRKHKGKYAA